MTSAKPRENRRRNSTSRDFLQSLFFVSFVIILWVWNKANLTLTSRFRQKVGLGAGGSRFAATIIHRATMLEQRCNKIRIVPCNINLDCKTVGFFSKSVKKSAKRGVRVWRARTARASVFPVSLSVFSLVPDLLFNCSRVLEYAKIRTVLRSYINLTLINYSQRLHWNKTPEFRSPEKILRT